MSEHTESTINTKLQATFTKSDTVISASHPRVPDTHRHGNSEGCQAAAEPAVQGSSVRSQHTQPYKWQFTMYPTISCGRKKEVHLKIHPCLDTVTGHRQKAQA